MIKLYKVHAVNQFLIQTKIFSDGQYSKAVGMTNSDVLHRKSCNVTYNIIVSVKALKCFPV